MAINPIVYTDKIVRSSRADYETMLTIYREADRLNASIRSRCSLSHWSGGPRACTSPSDKPPANR